MVWCTVPGCSPKDAPKDTIYHSLPTKNTELSKRWLLAIKNKQYHENIAIEQYKLVRVCGRHFTANDYERDLMFELGCREKHKPHLKTNAVPSVFPWDKTSKQPSDEPEAKRSRPQVMASLYMKMTPKDPPRARSSHSSTTSDPSSTSVTGPKHRTVGCQMYPATRNVGVYVTQSGPRGSDNRCAGQSDHTHTSQEVEVELEMDDPAWTESGVPMFPVSEASLLALFEQCPKCSNRCDVHSNTQESSIAITQICCSCTFGRQWSNETDPVIQWGNGTDPVSQWSKCTDPVSPALTSNLSSGVQSGGPSSVSKSFVPGSGSVPISRKQVQLVPFGCKGHLSPTPTAPVVKIEAPPPGPTAPVVDTKTPPPGPVTPVVKTETPPPTPITPVVKIEGPPPTTITPIEKTPPLPSTPTTPVVKPAPPTPAPTIIKIHPLHATLTFNVVPGPGKPVLVSQKPGLALVPSSLYTNPNPNTTAAPCPVHISMTTPSPISNGTELVRGRGEEDVVKEECESEGVDVDAASSISELRLQVVSEGPELGLEVVSEGPELGLEVISEGGNLFTPY